ncbi:polyprenyl synthetase family protein [Streptomyces sp. NPDC127084]|uniref:polyprenyl synthetase family protein n=1 Tax=Streptomyces sp. NPDC127084 TaxID=3347133 RepID=UPI003663467D
MLEVQPAMTESGCVVEPRTALDAAEAVGTVLEQHLETAMGRARDTDPLFARDVAGHVSGFVRRGGKRLRTAFTWCGWRAAGGSGDASEVLRTGAALELLQACALIHDDLMDGSSLRRGEPATHVAFARLHRAERMTGPPKSFAASAAVLAGDLALAWADDLLTELALDSPHGRQILLEWRAMRSEMVAGQYRDIHAQAAGTSSDVEHALTIATLKSALYTVERPMALGAALAAADQFTLRALRSAGRCAGLAFQLRDDLLGAFGDPALTGKPALDDLRMGKLTYLLAVALRLAEATEDEEATAVLTPSGAHRTEDTVERMRVALERTGARAAVESRIAELTATSVCHFATACAEREVRRDFATLVERASGVPLDPTGEGV